jgi:hypothetical protein
VKLSGSKGYDALSKGTFHAKLDYSKNCYSLAVLSSEWLYNILLYGFLTPVFLLLDVYSKAFF